MWFAFPCGSDGQYVVGGRQFGFFHYTRCIPCLFSWLVSQVACCTHTTNNSHQELPGVLFVDEEGQIAVAVDQDWQLTDNVNSNTS